MFRWMYVKFKTLWLQKRYEVNNFSDICFSGSWKLQVTAEEMDNTELRTVTCYLGLKGLSLKEVRGGNTGGRVPLITARWRRSGLLNSKKKKPSFLFHPRVDPQAEQERNLHLDTTTSSGTTVGMSEPITWALRVMLDIQVRKRISDDLKLDFKWGTTFLN